MMRQGVIGRFATVFAVVGALSGGHLDWATAAQAKAPQFEVATIKSGDPQAVGASTHFPSGPGGQFRMVNVPLKQWVEMGLSVKDYALKAPAWLDTSRFNLVAKTPADKPADPNAGADMMKALLVERFGLKWHQELQTVSGFELVPDKKVLVQPATLMERLRGGSSSSGPTKLDGTYMSMSDFAEALGKVLGRPVVDATHLSGGYDFKLTFRPMDDAAEAQARGFGMKDFDNLPSLLNAVREQLGLRLQSAKVPSKVIVVDNINRQPTGN